MTLLRLFKPLAGSGLALLTAFLPVAVQPATAQTLTAQATAQPSDSSHTAAVQRLIRNTFTPDYLENLYAAAAQQASIGFQGSIQPALGRALTEDESQRLYGFWDRKVREMMPYEVLEQTLVQIFTSLLTPADLELLNGPQTTAAEARFTELLPQIISEATAAGEQIAQSYVSDPVWMDNTLAELRTEFPDWFR